MFALLLLSATTFAADLDGDRIADRRDPCPAFWGRPKGCPGPDTDKDGVPDEADLCPTLRENANGIQDRDGCPEHDPDGDGKVAHFDACPLLASEDPSGCPTTDVDHDGVVRDLCPLAPETINGVMDDDGCPEWDLDGDGILDALDPCPTIPGDCPGPAWGADADHDGVPDTIDACPGSPENLNGVQDADGCPEPGPRDCPSSLEQRAEAGWHLHPACSGDIDNDGIPNTRDACPNDSGPGPLGCPPIDQDGDGLPDAEDPCPTTVACDIDKDSDGVPDPVDQCPEAPENRNGLDDADGCPDELPSHMMGQDLSGIPSIWPEPSAKLTLDAEATEVDDLALELGSRSASLGYNPRWWRTPSGVAMVTIAERYDPSTGIAYAEPSRFVDTASILDDVTLWSTLKAAVRWVISRENAHYRVFVVFLGDKAPEHTLGETTADQVSELFEGGDGLPPSTGEAWSDDHRVRIWMYAFQQFPGSAPSFAPNGAETLTAKHVRALGLASLLGTP